MALQNKPVIGMMIGKMLPPHHGHHDLISYGATHCDEMHVIVVERNHYQDWLDMPATDRVDLLKRIHVDQWSQLNLRFHIFEPPSHWPDIEPDLWAEACVNLIGTYPDFHFTHEGERDIPFARALRAGLVMPPAPPRMHSTEIRADLAGHLDDVHPITRSYLKEYLRNS